MLLVLQHVTQCNLKSRSDWNSYYSSGRTTFGVSVVALTELFLLLFVKNDSGFLITDLD
jgi:hypothetical protein